MIKRLRQLLDERALALPLALGVMLALSVSTTSVVYYSSSNSRSTNGDKGRQLAFSLAEAGINNAMGVLANPDNNAILQSLLPKCTNANGTLTDKSTWKSAAYSGGTAYWCGTFAISQAAWDVKALGVVRNPSGGGTIERLLKAYVPIQPVVSQYNKIPAWNYIFSTSTGAECDMIVNEGVTMSSALFVEGNLCLNNNSNVRVGPLIVKRRLSVGQSNSSVGESTKRIQVAVGGWDDGTGLKHCKQGNGQFHAGCGDADKVFSVLSDNTTAGVSLTPAIIAKPDSDYPYWYEHAMPGPNVPCTSSNGAASGPYPTFDPDTPWAATNRDVDAPTFNLTPATDYTCRIGPEGNPIGELSWDWNPTTATGVLKLRGVIYIDGSMYSNNGKMNLYDGRGTIYLSGTFLLDNNTFLCAVKDGVLCDGRVPNTTSSCPPATGWNPNCELLSIIAGGDGGAGGNQSQGTQIPAGYSMVIDNGSSIQGALYAQKGVKLVNNSTTDGPIIGSTVTISQNYTGDEFGTLTDVPPGMPGNPVVYAQPNPPKNFSG